MKPDEFGRKVAAHYGEWENELHKRAVWEYMRSKSERFCDSMYLLLREVRPSRYGPPELPDLRQLYPEAVRSLNTLPADIVVAQIEGPVEERATPEEVAGLARTIADLARRRKG